MDEAMTKTFGECTESNGGVIEPISDGNLLSVPGLMAGAVATGVKPSGGLDLAVIDAGRAVTAAGVFTRNELAAAPVLLCRERLAHNPRARCIVVNSGNANAMTGAQGARDAAAMVQRLEARCGSPALVLSTGIIGVPLAMSKVLGGIERAVGALSRDSGEELARAMLTTDTRTKTMAVRVQLPAEDGDVAHTATVGGVAKGSGMIHPDMATMLAIIATDVPMPAALAQTMLTGAVHGSFNTISVDGDTSTNDTVLLLAGGGPVPVVTAGSVRARVLADAIATVAGFLALEIVRDGEGATRLARIRVSSARSDDEARRVAAAIACSSLVKTALAGGDPNWGRILSAAANAGVGLTPERLQLRLGGIEVFTDGAPLTVDQMLVGAAFSRNEVDIELDLGLGGESAQYYTTDLTKGYVAINSEYTT